MHNEEDREAMRNGLREVSALLRAEDSRSQQSDRKSAIERVAEAAMQLISQNNQNRLEPFSEFLSKAR
jgi:hypothetical protein